jgi:hypothetical protein
MLTVNMPGSFALKIKERLYNVLFVFVERITAYDIKNKGSLRINLNKLKSPLLLLRKLRMYL